MTFYSSDTESNKKIENLQLDLNSFDSLKDMVKDKIKPLLTEHIKEIDIKSTPFGYLPNSVR